MNNSIISIFRMFLSTFLPCIGADTISMTAMFKQVFDPMISEQQNTEPFTWNEFERSKDRYDSVGKVWRGDARMGGNQSGIGSRLEVVGPSTALGSVVLPTAGSQQHVNYDVNVALQYGSFQVTGLAMESSKTDIESWARVKTEEIEGITRDTMKDLNRQTFGNGSGILATIKEDGPGAQDFDVYPTGTPGRAGDAINLRKGMIVDIYTAVGSAIAASGASRTITSIVPQSDGDVRVTLDAVAFAGVANQVILREKNAITNATNLSGSAEMMGLQGIWDDGTNLVTFETISRTTNPLWKGNYLGNSGVVRDVSDDLIQQLEDAIVEMSGKRPDWIRMNTGQRRKFFDIFKGDRRFTSKNFDGGYEKLSFNGLEIVVDIDCPKGMIFAGDKSSILRFELRKLGILDFDGLAMRQVAGVDSWAGNIGAYINLGSRRPNCGGILADLAEPAMTYRVRG